MGTLINFLFCIIRNFKNVEELDLKNKEFSGKMFIYPRFIISIP